MATRACSSHRDEAGGFLVFRADSGGHELAHAGLIVVSTFTEDKDPVRARAREGGAPPSLAV